jgi:hypothetical protein
MKRAYVAGPYTRGDTAVNVREAVLAADRISACGWAVFIPHLTHFWHILCPHEYEFWLAQDLTWLACCDCLVRLPGESPGADREVAFARERGLPVYEGLGAFEAAVREGE